MNVNKFLILVLITPLFCFSQNKKEDAYFIVNKNHKEYTLASHIIESNVTSFNSNSIFSLYDRTEYNKRQQEIAQEKKESTYWALGGGKRIPKTITFSVKSNKKETITHCDIHDLNLHLVNYNWLCHNHWKQNNPNILFKDLYFLFKIEKDKYIKYKVEATVIAY